MTLRCCWCNRPVWGGRLVPGWGYVLSPCLHVSYPREDR
jgi:hypothetical protein